MKVKIAIAILVLTLVVPAISYSMIYGTAWEYGGGNEIMFGGFGVTWNGIECFA